MGRISDALERHNKEQGLTFPTKTPRQIGQDATNRKQPQPLQSKESQNLEQNKSTKAKSVPAKKIPPKINTETIEKDLISITKPDSVETSLFKILRGKILFPVTGKPPRSIMVTSAVPGEGKSFIASNLAVNMAQNIDEYVLLVDCDLRKPSIHKKFGFGNMKGLSEYFSNGTELSSLFLKTSIDKLTIIPGGIPPANPSEMLSSDKMSDLIKEMESRYHNRYLVIDSPPPILAPEAYALSKWVDGIIVVIKYGSTPFDLIEEMMDNLDKDKILGAVINRTDKQTSRYYGYRKYGKYYRQYK